VRKNPSESNLHAAYALAQEQFAALGVDAEAALTQLADVPLSLHCWQGDDVLGLENTGEGLSGGIATTGNYPGRARNGDELRADLDLAYRLIPGKHRLSLHAMYSETGGKRVERNALLPEHFARWTDWAKANGHGLDFNPTLFSHPKAASGFTLASADAGIRQFWIEHCIASREIGAHFGQALGTPAITNIWIPDGYKDTPVDRAAPRARLITALDEVLAKKIDPALNRDAVEPKLFGLGSESYVAGSSEFYLGYAVSRQVLLCLDAGHYHPTETISDKISSVLNYLPEILLHVSRGVRWDSDHVVTQTDDLLAITQELVRGNFLTRTHIGLDFFDASINRVAAWVIGSRSTMRALLLAMLEPRDELCRLEQAEDYTGRLALLEAIKSLPAGAVWDEFCRRQGAPVGASFMDDIRNYEKTALAQRA
jgi:L-rhamnose isomerase